VWGYIVADFSTRVQKYFDLRSTLEPYSTVPGNILAALPALPDDVEYRFLGRHLILLDIRADVILDRITYAIRCTDCDDDSPGRGEKGHRD
jgi:hypothetical protein